jgi:hypothetical protein
VAHFRQEWVDQFELESVDQLGQEYAIMGDSPENSFRHWWASLNFNRSFMFNLSEIFDPSAIFTPDVMFVLEMIFRIFIITIVNIIFFGLILMNLDVVFRILFAEFF